MAKLTLTSEQRSRITADRSRAIIEVRSLGAAQNSLERDHGSDYHRHQHDDIATAETTRAGVVALRVETQRLLDRYRKARRIDERRWAAGERLYQAWYRSGVNRFTLGAYRVRVDCSGTLGQSDHQLDCERIVHRSLRAVGTELSPILVHVCICDLLPRDLMVAHGEPPQSGITVLRLGLSALAGYFQI